MENYKLILPVQTYQKHLSGDKDYIVTDKIASPKKYETITLMEYNNNIGDYTGDELEVYITSVAKSVKGLKSGYCILGTKKGDGLPFGNK